MSESSFQDDRPSRGARWTSRGKDAGSARIEVDTGATEDAASRRPAPHRGIAAHSEASSTPRAVAIDLDGTLGDTRPLWDAWLASAGELLDVDPETLPADRGAAATELDRRGAGNWRALLERFVEERVAVFLRRDTATSTALRALAATPRELGVFTDAPEPLARIALAQLGAAQRVTALEAGSGALERLLDRFGADAIVVRTRAELLQLAA